MTFWTHSRIVKNILNWFKIVCIELNRLLNKPGQLWQRCGLIHVHPLVKVLTFVWWDWNGCRRHKPLFWYRLCNAVMWPSCASDCWDAYTTLQAARWDSVNEWQRWEGFMSVISVARVAGLVSWWWAGCIFSKYVGLRTLNYKFSW